MKQSDPSSSSTWKLTELLAQTKWLTCDIFVLVSFSRFKTIVDPGKLK